MEQIFNGVTFVRDKSGYYRVSTNYSITMHRYVWEYYNGKIPDNCEIHHIDGNRGNNSIDNLQLMTVKEHKEYHSAHLSDEQREWRRNNINTNARPKAIEWHKSEEGREWHIKHITNQRLSGVFEADCKCLHCGKEFRGHVNSKFCSNACKSAYRRTTNADNVTRVCKVCGKEFSTNKYKSTMTCSRSCANRMRKLL